MLNFQRYRNVETVDRDFERYLLKMQLLMAVTVIPGNSALTHAQNASSVLINRRRANVRVNANLFERVVRVFKSYANALGT